MDIRARGLVGVLGFLLAWLLVIFGFVARGLPLVQPRGGVAMEVEREDGLACGNVVALFVGSVNGDLARVLVVGLGTFDLLIGTYDVDGIWDKVNSELIDEDVVFDGFAFLCTECALFGGGLDIRRLAFLFLVLRGLVDVDGFVVMDELLGLAVGAGGDDVVGNNEYVTFDLAGDDAMDAIAPFIFRINFGLVRVYLDVDVAYIDDLIAWVYGNIDNLMVVVGTLSFYLFVRGAEVEVNGLDVELCDYDVRRELREVKRVIARAALAGEKRLQETYERCEAVEARDDVVAYFWRALLLWKDEVARWFALTIVDIRHVLIVWLVLMARRELAGVTAGETAGGEKWYTVEWKLGVEAGDVWWDARGVGCWEIRGVFVRPDGG